MLAEGRQTVLNRLLSVGKRGPTDKAERRAREIGDDRASVWRRDLCAGAEQTRVPAFAGNKCADRILVAP